MNERKIDWVNVLFLSLTPLIGVFGTAAYALAFGIAWWEPLLLLLLFMAVSFSVTGGYHRCFAHRSYRCHPAVQAVYLFFGAMALQNSALKWSSDHRAHHRYVDRDWDPYSIKRGGLWAHMIWLFYKEPPQRSFDDVPDLQANPLVRWQFRWNNWIGILAGLGIPTLVGALFGRPLGGLLWGGFLRIALIHHTTFLINSVAHLYGKRPYTEENSARDNALLAFVTNGEGYHNFHHKFPSDFRNGVRWYQWDPTKWLIALLEVAGLARNVRKTPRPLIEKSRLRVRLARAEALLDGMPAGIAGQIRQRLESAHHALDRAVELWHEVDSKRRELLARGRTARSDIARSYREKLRESRAFLTAARREWRLAARMLARLPEEA
jgi:stearoyl-CoA desaturase (delta-9 desaturase)